MTDNYKYFLKADWMDNYTEVSKEKFINAERKAGFHSKLGPEHTATGGFSGGGISGRKNLFMSVE